MLQKALLDNKAIPKEENQEIHLDADHDFVTKFDPKSDDVDRLLY
jgi:hypothetical protein